jgi:hypothetical protein
MQRKTRNSYIGRLSFAIATILFSLFVYRQWALNWGATEEEINRKMPGDDVVINPTFNSTRAVTIHARPEEIWPWIIQIGYKKAGFYSYDRLDNNGIPSAKQIIPEYQDLKAGDLIPMSRESFAEVILLEPERFMLLVFQDGAWTNNTWAWGLYELDDEHTRLVTRLRVGKSSAVSGLMLDFFEIIMMRKCMLGIKSRAEIVLR